MTTEITIPTIETERLRLRAPVAEDFEAHVGFNASPRSHFVGGPYPRSHAFLGLCALAGHWQIRGYGRWIIADKDTDAALGTCGPFRPDGWPEPEIAWSLYDHAEGRGIAFEAASAARAWAYGTLGWTTAMSAIDPENTRSVRLAERLGCRPDGTFEHDVHGTLHIWRHPGPEEIDT